MFVKSIVLDGFKSYGQRTEITGFDSQFNAITGLNGSGKSNILDAICFVLGITNLSHVRATNLQELIYKCGQAGVNKATVSITFDNRNPEQYPPGFEDVPEITITRQVIIGGKNKYFINGSLVPNKRVQDLFCSVQLNVNNPHFLIMQGKITKVLNMKPFEILAMIEEAAGTKMYEIKKQSTQKSMEKKDAKITELTAILVEEISPKLEKLRRERDKYIEFINIERELSHMLGLFKAWEYIRAQKATIRGRETLQEGEGKVKKIEDDINKNKEMMTKIDEEVDELARKAETEGDEMLQKAEAELKAKEKEAATKTASINSTKDNIATEENKKKQLTKILSDDGKVLQSKQAELDRVKSLFEKLRQADAADAEALAISQKRFEALSAGMEINDAGEAETLQEQLIKVKQDAAEATTSEKQASMQLNFCQTQLKEKQKVLGSNAAEYQKDTTNLNKLKKEVAVLEKLLGEINFSEEKMGELQRRRQILTQEIRGLNGKIDNFMACKPYTQFRYRDPETNFNRRKVDGVVCRLFKVKDPAVNVAIETAAGSRLYNVVIDTEETGKKLLQRGNLQQRTTFIPLNKIQSHKMTSNAIRVAQELVGADNVQPAISHLTYDKKHQVVMEFILGTVFICKDINIARQVAFHDRVKSKCVTLDGDVVDPSGILSGGAPQKGGSILQQLGEIQQYEEQLRVKQQELDQVEAEIRTMAGYEENFMSKKQQVELKRHEMLLMTQRLQQTTHHRQQEEVNNLMAQIGELEEKITNFRETETKCNKKSQELQARMKNSKGRKDDQLKEAEAEMEKLKRKADKSRKDWQQREQEYAELNMEISELQKGVEETKQQIEATDKMIQQLKQQLEETQSNSEEIQATLALLQAEVKKEKGKIAEKNKDLQKRLEKKDELLAQNAKFELKIKEHNHQLKTLRDNFKHLTAKEKDLEKQIKKDNKYLTEAEKMNDNEGHDLEERIRRCNQTKATLARTVNAKAQSMFTQEEEQLKDVSKKLKIIEHDKKALLAIIADLDQKKRDTLKLACDQISKDFGSIFGTLLPGANAKLLPPTGQTIIQGLEVKVSLGDVWKESLTELSGGQRSLAALSLILAMLLFKPAPLYILDEVDAALDLSHTQNIGNMLKSHFKKSQFIIVSLKDGMFNNANVLFRTKFVDGVSTVGRTVNRNV